MQNFDEDYKRQIEELFRLHTSVQSVGFTGASYKPGLDNIRAFDAILGFPSRQLRSVHIAGTNGKGSVASMMAASLAACGLKVGLFTSPHLLDFRERIKILDPTFRLIPRETVSAFLNESGSKAGRLYEQLSFFEITTAMAFRWFADEKVDIAVVETGLGGRLDATNIIDPELSVITGIGLDHCAILGGTKALIATEKAGIFKPSRPVLVWGHDSETDPVFEMTAAVNGCRLHYGSDFVVPEGLTDIDLQGPYQKENLRTALAALEVLKTECRPGVPSSDSGILAGPNLDAIKAAARISGLRGRWEKISDEPETVCDIGHNPPALEVNFKKLKELGRPLTIVYGVMADKDLASISKYMPSEARYILVAPDTPRALPAADLYEKLRRLRPDLDTETSPSVKDGIKIAVERARADEFIFISGSTFVVAEALENF